MNHLVEIPTSDLIRLRNLYKTEWPKHLLGYYTLENFIRWIGQQPNIKNLKFLSLNGDWSNDGTFIIIDRYEVFTNSLDDTGSRIALALTLLDWSKGFKISSYMARHHNAVMNVISSKNLEIVRASPVVLYYFPKERASTLNLKPPKGITLKPLSKENAEFVNSVWPNKHIGSQFLIKRFINLNPNIGAYTDNEELVSMCLTHQCGALGSLQTVESYQRRGLATLVTIAMVKMLAELDMDAFALVGPTNFSSKRTFEKIGFQLIDNSYFTRTQPIVKPFVWQDDSDEE